MKLLSSILLLAGVALAVPQTATAPPTATGDAPATGNTSSPTKPGDDPVSGAANPITFPLGDTPIEVGKSITITWSPTYGDTIDLALRRGDSDNLDDVLEIAKDVENSGSYTWTPPSALEGGSDYAIQITSGSSTNYSPQFELESEGDGLSTTESASKTSATPSPSKSASESSSEKESMTTTTTEESSSPTASPSTSIRPAVDPANDSGAAAVKSPLALLVGVIAALAYFN